MNLNFYSLFDFVRHEEADHLRDEVKEMKNVLASKQNHLEEMQTAKASLVMDTEDLQRVIVTKDALISTLQEDILQ